DHRPPHDRDTGAPVRRPEPHPANRRTGPPGRIPDLHRGARDRGGPPHTGSVCIRLCEGGAMTVAIRALFTGVIGLLVTLGLIPESVQEQIIEHATTTVGAVLVLWSMVAGKRYFEGLKIGGEE